MCGITGFTWEDKELAKQALETIKHRGPNNQTIEVMHGVSLAHARLSIIDLSSLANQPMSDDYGNTIIFNGEIYNFEQIRSELEKFGHQFTTESDTEVLLTAWSAWGKECLHKLNGMFAFAVFNKKRKQLTLVRDRYGIKPLYYAYIQFNNKPHIIFGSEIHPIKEVLTEIGVQLKVSTTGLRDYFTLRYTLNDTLFHNIKKLPAGHYLTYDSASGSAKKAPWYVLPRPSFISSSVAKSNIRTLLNDSVRLRMIADVPVGFFLSGGIDSGIITKLAVDQKKILGESSDNIKTFSVGFEHAHELKEARQSAEYFETDHNELTVTDKLASEALKVVVNRSGEPVNDAAFIPTILLSEFARKKVTCVQAGEGSDEIFGGYDRYAFLRHAKKISPLANVTSKFSRNSLHKKLASMHKLNEFQRHVQAGRIFSQEEIGGPEQNIEDYKKYYQGNSLLQRAARFDLQTTQVNDFFVKADAMPMSVALEERVPFMDHRVVELGLSIKDKDKIRGNTKKILLRKSFPDLPKHLRLRKKRGYETPIDKWFQPKGMFREELTYLLDSSKHKLYDKSKAQQLLKSFKPTKSYMANFTQSQQLYGLLCFEMWYNENMSHKT